MSARSRHRLALPCGLTRRLGPWLGSMLIGWLPALDGCVRAEEMNALKATAEEMTQDIGALQVRLNARIDTGGGDVNEPVTSWILAAGYALVPMSFLAYLLAHRSRRFRRFKERIRGEATAWSTFAASQTRHSHHPHGT